MERKWKCSCGKAERGECENYFTNQKLTNNPTHSTETAWHLALLICINAIILTHTMVFIFLIPSAKSLLEFKQVDNAEIG